MADVEREEVGTIVIGGDAAAGPLPARTLERLMGMGERGRFVRGNADREIVEAYDQGRLDVSVVRDPGELGSVFAAGRITRTQRDFLAAFEERVSIEVVGMGPTLFCHGSPRSDTEIITSMTTPERLRLLLASVAEPIVVCGHTHRQFDRRIDRWRVVNAGSVGMPYEGRAGAYWAMLGPDVELRRTEYDLDAALAEMHEGGFPELDDQLRESLLVPVDPDQVSEFFERQALSEG
jgi:predicted phosphodiesterase